MLCECVQMKVCVPQRRMWGTEHCEWEVREEVKKSTHVVTVHRVPQPLRRIGRDRPAMEPSLVDRPMRTVLGHGQLGHLFFLVSWNVTADYVPVVQVAASLVAAKQRIVALFFALPPTARTLVNCLLLQRTRKPPVPGGMGFCAGHLFSPSSPEAEEWKGVRLCFFSLQCIQSFLMSEHFPQFLGTTSITFPVSTPAFCLFPGLWLQLCRSAAGTRVSFFLPLSFFFCHLSGLVFLALFFFL